MSEAGLVVETAKSEHTAALLELFERACTNCYCQYWAFQGNKNAWLERLFQQGELNRDAFTRDLASGQLVGMVALEGSRAVGWMKLRAAEAVPKIYEQRLYKGLPCFSGPRAGVHTIGCFLVDEERRRQGIARELVVAGIRAAKTAGATAIEALPRRSENASSAELWVGPSQIFIEAGFEVVNDFGPYPVLRYDLAGKTA